MERERRGKGFGQRRACAYARYRNGERSAISPTPSFFAMLVPERKLPSFLARPYLCVFGRSERMVASRKPAALQNPSIAFALGAHQFVGSLFSSLPGKNSHNGVSSSPGTSIATVAITAKPFGAVTLATRRIALRGSSIWYSIPKYSTTSN